MPSSEESGDGLETSSSPVRKRTRTGCLQCRNRRRKCDGKRPRCRGCEERNQVCRWGLKASFHSSRSISLSRHDAAALREVERARGQHARGHSDFIDETRETLDGYLTPDRPPSRSQLARGEERPTISTSHPVSQQYTRDLSVADLFHQFDLPTSDEHEVPEFYSPTVNHPQDHVFVYGFAAPGINNYSHSSSLNPILTEYSAPQLPVTDQEKLRLISAYLRGTGTWCETTDSELHFTVKSTYEMMKSPFFVGAALSLASRQLDYIKMKQSPVTLELYQFTIQLLLHQNPAQADEYVLATCTLLSVYEMMASRVEEWRRHLKGCAGFLRSKKWNGSCAGIVKVCFWAFARIDVWAAFNSGKATLIPTDSWVNDMSIDSVLLNEGLDDYCNLAILIFAKIVNLLPTVHGLKGGYSLTDSLHVLWGEIQKWYNLRPPEVCPLLRCSSPTKVFPEVVYTRSSPICANTFYHAGSMLLLQAGVRVKRSDYEFSSAQDEIADIIWHARELVGLSISNPSHANWVNQLQPLYIAGTVFGNSMAIPATSSTRIPEPQSPGHSTAVDTTNSDDFSAEKIILLKHLAKIERETGWKTSERAAELRALWGFV